MTHSTVFREQALELLRVGFSARAVGRQFGIDYHLVTAWAKLAGMELQKSRHGGLAKADRLVAVTDPVVDDNGRLTWAGRVVIACRIRDDWSLRRIAGEIGVAPSTISREVRAGSRNGHYDSGLAQRRSMARRARPKDRKLDDPVLRKAVVDRLAKKFSPEQVSADLSLCFPDRDDMQVSHEAIYQALYVQTKGALRHELTVVKALRSGRTSRKPQSKLPRRSQRPWIADGCRISDRPAEANDRAVPGHWEGDLVIGGANRRTALITLVERSSRFVLLSRLEVHDAETVTDRLITMIQDLPEQILRSLTWDQGIEMATASRFTVATGVKVFYCDPHSPWQRGSNENTNGLVRDFFPKGTNFATITDQDVAEAQHLLNIRPRKTLGWATPAATLDSLISNVALTS